MRQVHQSTYNSQLTTDDRRDADATGGRVVYPRNLQDVIGFYGQISRELGFSYSLGYSPKNLDDGKFHKIEVRVRGEGLKLTQSRDGYGGK